MIIEQDDNSSVDSNKVKNTVLNNTASNAKFIKFNIKKNTNRSSNISRNNNIGINKDNGVNISENVSENASGNTINKHVVYRKKNDSLDRKKNDFLTEDQKKQILIELDTMIARKSELDVFYSFDINLKLKIAKICLIKDIETLSNAELNVEILKRLIKLGYVFTYAGYIELLPEGYGFLHKQENSFTTVQTDIYVPYPLLKVLNVRKGDFLKVVVKAPISVDKFLAAMEIVEVNGSTPMRNVFREKFEKFRAIFPKDKFDFDKIADNNSCKITSRLIDFIAPLGFGQRALIVAPPRVGKTSIIHELIKNISYFHKDVTVFALLIGERPEEVTYMEDNTQAIVISSTFDDPAPKQIQAAEMTIARAKRLVEMGKDVVIFMDSLTRLARAYNIVAPNSNKVMTGGVDATALLKVKELFGAARNITKQGSLTIIGTVLVDTGSKMDTVIFEEFKGTSNCDIVLDRKASEMRMFPAMNIKASGTRNDTLLHVKYIKQINVLRKVLNAQENPSALKFIISKLKVSDHNDQLFESLNSTVVK